MAVFECTLTDWQPIIIPNENQVTRSDIFTHFLDTLININEYMYRFVDTTGGNLSDTTFHQVIRVVTPLALL
jgi:hypothetical protein